MEMVNGNNEHNKNVACLIDYFAINNAGVSVSLITFQNKNERELIWNNIKPQNYDKRSLTISDINCN